LKYGMKIQMGIEQEAKWDTREYPILYFKIQFIVSGMSYAITSNSAWRDAKESEPAQRSKEAGS
jgi:hypothetical protein